MRIISKIEKLGNFQGEIKQRSGDMQRQHKCFALTKGETTHFLLNKAYLYPNYEFPLVEYGDRKAYDVHWENICQGH